MMRALVFIVAAVVVGVWTAADVLLRAVSSLPRACRRRRDVRYAGAWGLPPEALSEEVQQRVAATLRCDAIRGFGVTNEEWQEFVEAHSEKTEEAQ
jgi:hypothetical protein